MASRFRFSPVPGGGESDPWFRIGTLDVNTTTFTSIAAAVMFVVFALVPSLFEALVLDPFLVWRSGQVWRVATWPMANDISFWSVITIFFFWYFGTFLEQTLGRTKMANLLVWVTLCLGVLTVALSVLFQDAVLIRYGLGTIGLIVLLLFIAENPYIRFFFNIPGWVIGAIFVALPVLSYLSQRDFVGLVDFVVGLALAAVVARSLGLLRDYHQIPDLAFFRHRQPRQARRSQGPGTVVSGPWTGSSSQAASDRAKLDDLLDKIGATGMDSLTKSERKQLEVLRRRLRGE
ncbi:MAG: rhomboid family intramembrane serine protease [Nocardioides sp.]|uniref:DUF6576 domain-containing protein n=1 Tax=Nocardioides sp. TaxID=35761 RepID=UPI0039E3C7C8